MSPGDSNAIKPATFEHVAGTCIENGDFDMSESMTQLLARLEALVERAESELLAVREDNHSMMMEIDGLRTERDLLAAELQKMREQKPVAMISQNDAGQISIKNHDGTFFDMSKHVGCQFYAAPVTAPAYKKCAGCNGHGMLGNGHPDCSDVVCHFCEGTGVDSSPAAPVGASLATPEAIARAAKWYAPATSVPEEWREFVKRTAEVGLHATNSGVECTCYRCVAIRGARALLQSSPQVSAVPAPTEFLPDDDTRRNDEVFAAIKPGSAAGIMSPMNACMHRDTCRAMLQSAPMAAPAAPAVVFLAHNNNSKLLFAVREEAERFAASCGPAAGVAVTEYAVIGSKSAQQATAISVRLINALKEMKAGAYKQLDHGKGRAIFIDSNIAIDIADALLQSAVVKDSLTAQAAPSVPEEWLKCWLIERPASSEWPAIWLTITTDGRRWVSDGGTMYATGGDWYFTSAAREALKFADKESADEYVRHNKIKDVVVTEHIFDNRALLQSAEVTK